MVSEKKSGPSLKWLMFTVFLLVAGLVYYDIKGEGSWQGMIIQKNIIY